MKVAQSNYKCWFFFFNLARAFRALRDTYKRMDLYSEPLFIYSNTYFHKCMLRIAM